MANQAILRRLGELSTCDVADTLVKLGFSSGGFLPFLQTFSPCPSSSEIANFRICGPAFTVLFAPAGQPYPTPPPTEHHIDAAPSGSVMILQSPEGAVNAIWGGLMSAGAKAKGVQGVVIDGNCRDILEHREMGFPVIAKGHSILGFSTFSRPVAHQIPLTFHSPTSTSASSPAIINPGDIILADIDGVVVVPVDLVEQVLDLAIKGKAVDERIKKDLEAGMGVEETMKKHRG